MAGTGVAGVHFIEQALKELHRRETVECGLGWERFFFGGKLLFGRGEGGGEGMSEGSLHICLKKNVSTYLLKNVCKQGLGAPHGFSTG